MKPHLEVHLTNLVKAQLRFFRLISKLGYVFLDILVYDLEHSLLVLKRLAADLCFLFKFGHGKFKFDIVTKFSFNIYRKNYLVLFQFQSI